METISKIKDKINSFSQRPVFTALLYSFITIFLMGSSFMLGRISILSQKQEAPQSVEIYLPNGQLVTKETISDTQSPLSAYILGGAEKGVVPENGPTVSERLSLSDTVNQSNQNTIVDKIFGSKNGSTYYVPGCKAGNRVKIENRVYFESESDAEDEGYSRSKSCK